MESLSILKCPKEEGWINLRQDKCGRLREYQEQEIT